MVVVCLFILNDISWAQLISSSNSKSTLATPSELTKPEFKERFSAQSAALMHAAINYYIAKQIKNEKGILGDGWDAKRTLTLDVDDPAIKGNIENIAGLKKIKLIKIADLFKKTGQAAHVGLSGKGEGFDYGMPVMYVDSEYWDKKQNTIIKHELDEILQWEELRSIIAKAYEIDKDSVNMRAWIKAYIKEADGKLDNTKYKGLNSVQIAKQIHDKSYSLRGLYKLVDFNDEGKFFAHLNFDYIQELYARFIDDEGRDINIAASMGENDELSLAQGLNVTDLVMEHIKQYLKKAEFNGKGATYYLFENHLSPELIRDKFAKRLQGADILVVETAPMFLEIFQAVSAGKLNVDMAIEACSRLYRDDLHQETLPKADEKWFRQYFELLYDKHKYVVCVPGEIDKNIALLQIEGQHAFDAGMKDFISVGNSKALSEGVQTFCQNYAQAYMKKDESLGNLLTQLREIAPKADILVVRGYMHSMIASRQKREARLRGDSESISIEFFTKNFRFSPFDRIMFRFMHDKSSEVREYLRAGLYYILTSDIQPETFTIEGQNSITRLVDRIDLDRIKKSGDIAKWILENHKSENWGAKLRIKLEGETALMVVRPQTKPESATALALPEAGRPLAKSKGRRVIVLNDAEARAASYMQLARGPQWLDAYKDYLALAKEHPEVITDEWVDLIVSYWPVSSLPICFEIFTELARLRPNVVITPARIDRLVEVFAYLRPLTEEALRRGRLVLDDGFTVGNSDLAIEQFGELVKIDPTILTPERVMHIIITPYRSNIPDYHIRGLAVPIFEEWLKNEDVKRKADPETLRIVREYIENPNRFDPFNVEFSIEAYRWGHGRQAPPAAERQALLSVDDTHSCTLMLMRQDEALVLTRASKKTGLQNTNLQNPSLVRLKTELQSAAGRKALPLIQDIFRIAADLDLDALLVMMNEVFDHLESVNATTRKGLDPGNYLASMIDELFGNNRIWYTRLMTALHRVSLVRSYEASLNKLLSANPGLIEISRDEAARIGYSETSCMTPEGYLSKRVLLRAGFRFDSKKGKWIRPGKAALPGGGSKRLLAAGKGSPAKLLDHLIRHPNLLKEMLGDNGISMERANAYRRNPNTKKRYSPTTQKKEFEMLVATGIFVPMEGSSNYRFDDAIRDIYNHSNASFMRLIDNVCAIEYKIGKKSNPLDRYEIPDVNDRLLVKELVRNLCEIENIQYLLDAAKEDEDKCYVVKYNENRLQDYERSAGIKEGFLKMLLDNYADVLRIRLGEKDKVEIKPSSSTNSRKQPLISVECYHKQTNVLIGKGHVNIEKESLDKDSLLRIIDMANIAFAVSNIPLESKESELNKYNPLIFFIQNRFKELTGKDISLEDILKDDRIIKLPAIKPVPADRLPIYYELTIKQLEQAA